jgi:hypothetical protein
MALKIFLKTVLKDVKQPETAQKQPEMAQKQS